VIGPSKSEDPLEALWQKADDAAQREDFRGVLFVLRSLADKGIWQANARIGEIYEAGAKGVAKDTREALKWYRKAVFEGDDPIGHLGLGRAYFEGKHTDRDFLKAQMHLQNAYSAKIPQAALYLGIIHYSGAGVVTDVSKAADYFKVAADASYFLAYGYLARIALSEGKILKGLKLFFQGWRAMIKISKKDPNDPRLLGIEDRHN